MIVNITYMMKGVLYISRLSKNDKTGITERSGNALYMQGTEPTLSIIKKFIATGDRTTFSIDTFVDEIEKISVVKEYHISTKHFLDILNNNTPTSNIFTNDISLSVLYLDNKPLPRIKHICPINDEIYFVTKMRKNYSILLADTDKLKCKIGLENLIYLYKAIKALSVITNEPRNKNKYNLESKQLIEAMEEMNITEIGDAGVPSWFTRMKLKKMLLQQDRQQELLTEVEDTVGYSWTATNTTGLDWSEISRGIGDVEPLERSTITDA